LGSVGPEGDELVAAHPAGSVVGLALGRKREAGDGAGVALKGEGVAGGEVGRGLGEGEGTGDGEELVVVLGGEDEGVAGGDLADGDGEAGRLGAAQDAEPGGDDAGGAQRLGVGWAEEDEGEGGGGLEGAVEQRQREQAEVGLEWDGSLASSRAEVAPMAASGGVLAA
jgi:hypothetical protein